MKGFHVAGLVAVALSLAAAGWALPPQTAVQTATALSAADLFQVSLTPNEIAALNYYAPVLTPKKQTDPLAALIDGPPIPTARPKSRALSKKDVTCLTDNIYHEARGEGEDGWQAVMAVVLNRLKDPRWPKTICGVVYQPYAFSWTLERPPVKNKPLWNQIRAKVLLWASYGFESNVDDSTHYHANYVSPYWADDMVSRDTIGLHLFYHESTK